MTLKNVEPYAIVKLANGDIVTKWSGGRGVCFISQDGKKCYRVPQTLRVEKVIFSPKDTARFVLSRMDKSKHA